MLGIDDKGMSLKDFIGKNHHLLSTMAVLTAIASFGVTLSIHWLGSILVFLSTAGVMTVWVELYKSFPETGTLRLVIFKNILSLGLFSLGFYWLIAFPTFWNIFSFVPLFALMFYLLHTNIKQITAFSFVQRLFGKKGKRNPWQQLLVFLYGIGMFYALTWMFAMSITAAPGLNMILELIRNNFN